MTVGICIIAHAPLASALKTCAMHIYSMTGDTAAERIEAYDVPSTVDTEAGFIEAQQRARRLLEESHEGVLVFTDILGATPANIAHRLLDDPHICVISGVNLPAIIAALNAPADAPVSQVMTLAEAAARAGLSSQSGRSDNA